MRKGILVLYLLLAVSICNAQSNITNFTIPYLYKGENYSTDVQAASITLSYGNYSLVSIKQTATFLLNMSVNPSFVEDQGQVSVILNDYYRVSTYPTQAELNDLNASFNSFLASRGPDELECRVITGLSNPDGSPLSTCTADNQCESCRAVPVCHDYMVHTLTSPELMSSPLAQSVMAMSYDFNIIETNASKFESSLANVNSDVSSSMSVIEDSLNSIISTVNDLGKPPASRIYEQYAVAHSNYALDFCKNFYTQYNLTALNNAVSKASSLRLRVPTQSAIAGEIASVVSGTAERKLNRTIREQREAFDAKYSVWLAQKDNLTGIANRVLSRISDNETPAKLVKLDSILLQIRQLGDARNYSQADLLAQNFSQDVASTGLYLSGLLTSYDSLLVANSSASDSLFEARLYTAPDDLVTTDRLEGLETQKASLEFTIYNQSPMSLSKVNNVTDQLNDIRLSANSIRDQTASASPQELNSLLAAVVKPVVSLSFGILNSFIPLSYADREKNAPLIIGAMLVIADIVIFLAVLAAFFFLVRSRKIELHRLAKMLWAFIFAFFFLLMALGSLTIYNVVNMQSQPTTFTPFMSEFRSSGRVGVVANLTSLNGTMRESMTNCSSRIASKIESLNKTVMYYRFDNESCISGNDTLSTSACQDLLDANPVIMLQSGADEKATFIVFYTKYAVFQGDEAFFWECPITKVLS
ncbi:hypothetical protein H0N99_01845 [Candidatus Micrarchaeota archaeon]|nr:hypothetical protein [Candidatus Micrarchaeota archaeon]